MTSWSDPDRPAGAWLTASRQTRVVVYDGAAFHGFAATPGIETVAGVLRGALERVLRHDVELVGAGRTDAGVHAWGQVVSFDVDRDRFDPAGLQRSVNGLCGPALVLRSIEEAEPDFHARFSATWRRYRYTVRRVRWRIPSWPATAWYVDARRSRRPAPWCRSFYR